MVPKELIGDPRFSVGGSYATERFPHMGVVFAPRGISETLNTLQTAHTYRPEHVGIVTVTEAPKRLQGFQRALIGSESYLATHLQDDFLMQSDVPKSAIGGGLTHVTIFVEREHLSGETVADVLRALRPKKISVLSNTHAGMERLVAETGQHLLPDYNLHVTPLWANEILTSKYRFTQLQEELDLPVPMTTLVKSIDDSGEKKEGRELKEEILNRVHTVGLQTKGDVIIKPDSAFGSERYYRISGELTYSEKETIVKEYLEGLDIEGAVDTIVQAFVKGVDVGAFITVSGGEIHIDYTRKIMAKGKDKRRSEEVEHAFDPDDPINILCETVLTPKLERIIRHLGLDNTNQTYNADAILDEKYFDQTGKVTTHEEVEEDRSFIIEINDRQGGEGMRQFWSKVYGLPFDAAVLHANLGDDSIIYEMNSAVPKRAAIMHTVWPDYTGPVLKPAYPGHIYNIYGVFYVSSFNQLAVQDNDVMAITQHMRTLQEIEDWRTKGDRLVVGVSHEDMPTTRILLNTALGKMGMLGLSPNGIVYIDSSTGKLVEKIVESESPLGEEILINQYGCTFEGGKWSRP